MIRLDYKYTSFQRRFAQKKGESGCLLNNYFPTFSLSTESQYYLNVGQKSCGSLTPEMAGMNPSLPVHECHSCLEKWTL